MKLSTTLYFLFLGTFSHRKQVWLSTVEPLFMDILGQVKVVHIRGPGGLNIHGVWDRRVLG